jgi:hypothetical protein
MATTRRKQSGGRFGYPNVPASAIMTAVSRAWVVSVGLAVVAGCTNTTPARAPEPRLAQPPPPPPADVRFTQPDAPFVIASLRPAIRACYDQALAKAPNTSGCAFVTSRVDGQGFPKSVRVLPADIPPELVTCVRQVFMSANLGPAPVSSRAYVIPITFIPNGQSSSPACEESRISAAHWTNSARDSYNTAIGSSDPKTQRAAIEETISRYQSAQRIWLRLAEKPGAGDAIFWAADAAYWSVVLQLKLERDPRPEEIAVARDLAERARVATTPFQEAVDFYPMSIADQLLARENRRYEASMGKVGFPKKPTPDPKTEPPPKREALPALVSAALAARERYLSLAPSQGFEVKRSGVAFETGQLLFAYGEIERAVEWLRKAEVESCRVNRETATKAFELRRAIARDAKQEVVCAASP